MARMTSRPWPHGWRRAAPTGSRGGWISPGTSTPTVGEPTRLGLVLDVETTGLDPRADEECIELAMLPFLYTETGRITAVLPPFSRLRQPTLPSRRRSPG